MKVLLFLFFSLSFLFKFYIPTTYFLNSQSTVFITLISSQNSTLNSLKIIGQIIRQLQSLPSFSNNKTKRRQWMSKSIKGENFQLLQTCDILVILYVTWTIGQQYYLYKLHSYSKKLESSPLSRFDRSQNS